MQKQKIIISQNLRESLEQAIIQQPHDKLFVLTDETTYKKCWPVISGFPSMQQSEHIVIGATDEHKSIETLISVWTELSQKGGTRHSLLVNLGGGMVTDLGGFAASTTFKRGIPYINIPTTLLAMVDAAVGGKTGINFNGLKNEIGAFAPAASVLLDTEFLRTLDYKNICSGYAENVVAQDPYEQGIRKALNLGHTAGHALESLALAEERTVLHGYAVAWGLVCELYLSCLREDFPKDKLRQTTDFIKRYYGVFPFDCKAYETLYQFMTHDKKNTSGEVNFTLLGGIGDIRINRTAGKDEIFNMLDFYRETMGC